MTHIPSQFSPDTFPDIPFTPVPVGKTRHDGWSTMQQKRFVAALSVMGSVRHAARAIGMGRQSAYRLRERDGAESFAQAWDEALEEGRKRMFCAGLERAINGVTTVRILRGGSVTLSGGPDMTLVRASLNENNPPVKATKGTV
jgi:hypothetical protein